VTTCVSWLEMVADFKEVTQHSTAVLYFDTTFSLGDFYVSAPLYHNDMFVLVADREAAITRATEAVFQQSKVVYRWNHIRGDKSYRSK